MQRTFRKAYYIFLYTLLATTVILHLLAWRASGFADLYRNVMFSYMTKPLRTLSGAAEGSVGEIMIVIGVTLLIVSVFVLISVIPYCILHKKPLLQIIYMKFFLMLLAVISVIMTLNCFILYHCSSFDRLYLPDQAGRTYGFEELAELRDHIVTQANGMAKQFRRDEEGNVIYDGSISDMKGEAVKSMVSLGESLPLLRGDYNLPKELRFSNFMSQQRMQGYYFPFSMEANINANMTTIRKPATMCHELSHTKGFLYEDEANFIAFLACIESNDPYFRYSGYLSVLNYVNNDFYRACDSQESYDNHPAISETVRKDNRFLTEKAELEMEQNALFPTEKVEEAAQTFIDTNLAANGIPEGSLTYGYVVKLLLEYYDANGQVDI